MSDGLGSVSDPDWHKSVRRAAVRGEAPVHRARAWLLAIFLAVTASALSGACESVAQTTPPEQPQGQPQGPIVGGHRLQPRPDQLPDPDISDEDAKRLKELSREVLDASDPAKITRRRQHQ